VPVIWLLGLLPVFGLGLDPMSILVPFLIFSIAVSHAVQMTNAWKLETLHGADGVTASTHSLPESCSSRAPLRCSPTLSASW